MEKIKKEILKINLNIEKNLEKISDIERGFYSQNILKKLRDFVEHTALLIYSNGNDIDNSYENIKNALSFLRRKGQFRFLSKFHKFLQKVASHYTVDEDSAERLMLKYYENLLQLKNFLKENYNLEVLKNIDKPKIGIHGNHDAYYEKITQKLNTFLRVETRKDRYYIQKIKPFL